MSRHKGRRVPPRNNGDNARLGFLMADTMRQEIDTSLKRAATIRHVDIVPIAHPWSSGQIDLPVLLVERDATIVKLFKTANNDTEREHVTSWRIYPEHPDHPDMPALLELSYEWSDDTRLYLCLNLQTQGEIIQAMHRARAMGITHNPLDGCLFLQVQPDATSNALAMMQVAAVGRWLWEGIQQ